LSILQGNSCSISQKSGEIWAVQTDLQQIYPKSDRLLEQKADEITAYLVGALESPLWEISVRGIESTANSVFQDESVVRLVVKDDEGSIVFSKEKKNTTNW